MSEVVQPTVRVVPGAPPPKEPSKSLRKKRKTKPRSGAPDVIESSSAASIDKAPEQADIQAGAVASDLVAQPETASTIPVEEESAAKTSPIVELIQKRLKVTSKKISRITTYAATDAEKLNEDQKATLKTLPGLEAVQKELGEVKKAVETHEAQLVNESTQRRQEAERAEKARITSAVAAAQTAALAKVSDLLSVLRLRSLLGSGESASTVDTTELSTVFAAADALLSEAGETHQAVLAGFMLGQGDFEGVPYTRILEITQLALNPPEAPASAHDDVEANETSTEVGPEVAASAQQPAGSMSGSYAFLNASEIEPSFEETAEWVERSEATGHQEEQIIEPVNGHIQPDEPIPTSNAALDWAADDEEGGLPPIAGLHAKFGTSGSATPVAVEELQTNGHTANTEPLSEVSAPAAPEEDDGFTQARGRGRPRGSFRGNEQAVTVASVEETVGAEVCDVTFTEQDTAVGVNGGAMIVGAEEAAVVLAMIRGNPYLITSSHPLLHPTNDMSLDLSLYLVTDRTLLPPGKSYLESLEQALIGGVTVVQIREKTADTAEFLQVAQESKALCDRYNVPLIINDRIDIALAVGAQGVHLGQTDMPIQIARKLLPKDTIIGISCNTVDEVRLARESNADYLGLGAVWDTQTKKLTKTPIGVRGLGPMLAALDGSNIKAVAIGGIKSTNLARLMHGSVSATEHWLDGIAVVSDIIARMDPQTAAYQLKSIFTASRLAEDQRTQTRTLSLSRDDALEKALAMKDAVRRLSPLVHQMTNVVVANQSANITLSLGASPIMATAPEEMADLSKISHALLVNIGTLVAESVKGMLKAGQCANASRNPIVLDPVGIGASQFRKTSVNELLNGWQAAVIKGNAGELAALAGSSEVASKGVDSQGAFNDPVYFARQLARNERCVVVLTGETDYISDGDRVLILRNGDPLLGKITGSGCMLGSCIASFCAAANLLANEDDHHQGRLDRGGDFFSAAVGAVLTLTVASELAAKREDVHGVGTFLPALIDEVANLKPDDIKRLAKIEEAGRSQVKQNE
ncbi:TMP-TENI-domain-containing protein [Favolaschia claudopus]|uniref:TMP-TENI-domain-containing protein n=1 Tax=Favolaschia claudopus TaxID=2862362 RepID=A0AAW0E0I8_9AGAR